VITATAQELKEMIEHGMTLDEIAEDHKVPTSFMRKIMKSNNVNYRDIRTSVILKMAVNGSTTTDIARFCGTEPCKIRSLFRRRGISLPRSNQKITNELLKELVDQGKTVCEIAKALDVTRQTVWGRLKSAGMSTLHPKKKITASVNEIKEMMRRMPIKEIAAMYGATPGAVHKRVGRSNKS